MLKPTQKSPNNKVYKLSFTSKISMLSRDPKGLLDDLLHTLSPRYLACDMPGFLFSISGGKL